MLKRMWGEVKRRPKYWLFYLVSCEFGVIFGMWLAGLTLGDALERNVLLPVICIMPVAVIINLAIYVAKRKDKR